MQVTLYLLHNHGQVHVGVNAAVKMVGTSRIEWPDHLTLTGGAKLHVAHRWRTRFRCRFGCSINPGTVANDVRHRNIIDQVEAAALADRDRRLILILPRGHIVVQPMTANCVPSVVEAKLIGVPPITSKISV